jgi:hypothetical protein
VAPPRPRPYVALMPSSLARKARCATPRPLAPGGRCPGFDEAVPVRHDDAALLLERRESRVASRRCDAVAASPGRDHVRLQGGISPDPRATSMVGSTT